MVRIADLSVVIATLGRPEGLARCLGALQAGQALPAEIIIVDQNRDDLTQSLAEKFQARMDSFIYVRQGRRGLSAARNVAIARASSGVIAFTDDDCVPDPGWVAIIDKTFAALRAPDAVTGRVLPLGPEEPGTYPISLRENTVRADFTGKHLPWFVGTGGNFAARHEWFSRVGSFDERLGAGSSGKAAEDADLIYRLLCAGARVRYEPSAIIYHERKNKSRRMATRWSYGYGIGAFCGIWLGRRDPYALWCLSHYAFSQCKGLATAIAHREWLGARQRLFCMGGIGGGLIYGLRVFRERPVHQ